MTWHLDGRTWEQPYSKVRIRVEFHVGIGSEQDDREMTALGGNEEAEDEFKIFLPHGQ